MKQLTRWMLTLLAVGGFTLLAGAAERRTTLAIKADGSCALTNESVQPRLVVEQQVRRWERYSKVSEDADDDEDAPPETEPKEPRPFTDAELSAKIREMKKPRIGQIGDEEKIELLDVGTNTVRSITSRSFAALEDLLRQAYVLWSEAGFAFENLRFEKDANGHLRVTFTPLSGRQRNAKAMRSQWKLTGLNSEFKLVFPGKVLTSGLPQTQGNATWITLDPKKDETIDAALQLYDTPTVIIAELGGLKLDRPLESKTLQHRAGRGSATSDLPITDAGPGFVAEPVSVTVSTLHYFPDGEKQMKKLKQFGAQSTGVVVHAKLFAPKGRTLQSISGVKILQATDDKGRAIAAAREESEPFEMPVQSSGRGDPAGSTRLQIQLQLPSPDAQSIDELSAETIAVTAGQWRELTLTNVQENATNEVDLAAVLPGAKLVITKLTSKNRQLNLQAQLQGPPAIRQLDIQGRIPGNARANTHLSERNFTSKGGQSTRAITLQGYVSGPPGTPGDAVSLLVRFPEDVRRERVKFKLTGLDLF